MTPKTAAALRALVQEMGYVIHRARIAGNHSFLVPWRDKLSAVLTQEGADTRYQDAKSAADDLLGEVCACVGKYLYASDQDADMVAILHENKVKLPISYFRRLYDATDAPAEPRAASDELTTFAANLAANQRVPDDVDAIVNANIDKLLDEPRAAEGAGMDKA